jgi:integrase
MASLSPTTLTADEQALILRATASNLRDHTIISLALGTGLRLAEIVGLNIGDVFTPDGTPRVRVRLRKEIAKGGRAADVFLPDRLVAKLRRFWNWKLRRGEGIEPGDPLFANQSGRRISKRRVQFAWATWQRRTPSNGESRFGELHERTKTLDGRFFSSLLACLRELDPHEHQSAGGLGV